MKIKKILSAAIASVMLITAVSIPASAASLTFVPAGPAQTYKLKITASIGIYTTKFAMNDNITVNSEALSGSSISVSSPGKSSVSGTILTDDKYKPTLNGSKIDSTSLSFGFSSGSPNTIIGGDISKFTWVGYVEFSDKSKHPVTDLGLTLSQLNLGKDITVSFQVDGSPYSIPLNESIVGEVITETNNNTFTPGNQISVKSSFNEGKGLTIAQQDAIKKSKSSNFTVTAVLDKAITDDIVIFTLTTDIMPDNTNGIVNTAVKNDTSVKFTVPKAYFYDSVYYNILFSWLKIASTSTSYTFKSITIDYDGTATGGTGNDNEEDTDEEFNINYTAVTLNVGASINLKTNYDSVSWKSANSAIVRSFSNGKITAVKAGTTTITGTNEDGDTVKCKVTVKTSKTPVTALSLTKKSGTVYVNCSYSISGMMKINPTKHTDTITWTSSDTDIATVSSSGKVKVLSAGDVTITVTSSSGKSASLLLKCKEPSVVLSKYTATISAGKTTTIGVKSYPTSAKVTYESYNEGVATVNSSGVVTGIKAGTAKIIVRNNKGGSAICTVTVK